jgi:hypothetical protein
MLGNCFLVVWPCRKQSTRFVLQLSTTWNEFDAVERESGIKIYLRAVGTEKRGVDNFA